MAGPTPPTGTAAQLHLDDQATVKTTDASSSSTNSSPSMLPYLRDSSPSPQTISAPSTSESDARVPGPRAGPSLLSLSTAGPSTSTAASTSPLSASSTTSTSSKSKKRPKPLILGRQEIGQDEELSAQLQTDGRWSARSGIEVVTPRESVEQRDTNLVHTYDVG